LNRDARFRESLAEHALDSRLDDRQVLENLRDGPSVGAWFYIAPRTRDAVDSGTQAFVLSVEMAEQFFCAWMHRTSRGAVEQYCRSLPTDHPIVQVRPP